ncbi:hypothetical protein TNCV_3025771 [Trichonephila clavipes]|nr:hypothetical protein TNCV_3025771 [Trichonephila clavipes]
MNRYTNAELADIQLIYDLANGNGRVAVRLYGESYPTRRQSNHQTLTRLYHNLVEHGSFRATIDDMSVNSEMDLVARISIVAATICETPDTFEHVRQSISRRVLHYTLNCAGGYPRPSDVVATDADCCSVGPGFESWRRHGCL